MFDDRFPKNMPEDWENTLFYQAFYMPLDMFRAKNILKISMTRTKW